MESIHVFGVVASARACRMDPVRSRTVRPRSAPGNSPGSAPGPAQAGPPLVAGNAIVGPSLRLRIDVFRRTGHGTSLHDRRAGSSGIRRLTRHGQDEMRITKATGQKHVPWVQPAARRAFAHWEALVLPRPSCIIAGVVMNRRPYNPAVSFVASPAPPSHCPCAPEGFSPTFCAKAPRRHYGSVWPPSVTGIVQNRLPTKAWGVIYEDRQPVLPWGLGPAAGTDGAALMEEGPRRGRNGVRPRTLSRMSPASNPLKETVR